MASLVLHPYQVPDMCMTGGGTVDVAVRKTPVGRAVPLTVSPVSLGRWKVAIAVVDGGANGMTLVGLFTLPNVLCLPLSSFYSGGIAKPSFVYFGQLPGANPTVVVTKVTGRGP